MNCWVYHTFLGAFDLKWEFGKTFVCHLIEFDKFILGFLLMLCQKEPQEDGSGGDFGTAGNIGGELGSILPYPTLIPTGLKKLFCPFLLCLFFMSLFFVYISYLTGFKQQA